jgi:hypothetical protein
VFAKVLLLLFQVTMGSVPSVNAHIDFRSLQQLDYLSSGQIQSLDDAKLYVRKSATLCGIFNSYLVSDHLESRLAADEFDAAKESNKLVSDDQVAQGFNFLSGEFAVAHPVHLLASDILQYRSVMSALFPHVFSAKNINGSRPVAAIVMLYMLVYNGGITEGVKRLGEVDHPPGSLKISPTSSRLVLGSPTLVELEYRAASRAYFERQPPQAVQSLLEQLAGVLSLPARR